MNIAFIFYSHTGHTKKVGKHLVDQLNKDGHKVRPVPLQPVEQLNLSSEVVAIEKPPDIQPFDVLILGTPVHGGRMSAPMRAFLNQLPQLSGMPTVLLLTHFFKKEWGAIQTVQNFREVCVSDNLELIGYTTIRWFSLRRKKQISSSVREIRALIKNI